MELKDNMKL